MQKEPKKHCFFTHGILESRFLLWGLYLLICMRTVECCTNGEQLKRVWWHNRWCITISSCSCFLARENFWFRYSLLLECFPDGKKSVKQKSRPQNFGRENPTLGPPIPSSGHSSPGAADWPWNALAQRTAAPGERGPRHKVTVWEQLIRRLPALTREVTNIRNTRSTDSRTSLNLRFTFHLIGVSMTTCARPDA